MERNTERLLEFYVEEVSPMEGFGAPEENKKKKKNPYLKFIVYFTLVVVFTGLALFMSLRNNFKEVIGSIKNANVGYLFLILGMMVVSFLLEGLIILLFGRLYTRMYHFKHGLATSLVGAFYDSVTPGATGGQLMQIMTIKKQGINVSQATSIIVMYIIIKQFAMVLIDLLGVIFKYKLLISIGSFHISLFGNSFDLPALPLTLIGFAYNVIFTLGIVLLSYWKWFHHFICNIVVNFLAKIKIIKKPDEVRENVRVSVENFRIELKRLFTNAPVFIFTFIVCFINIAIRYSIPFFAGLALDGFDATTTGQANFASMWGAIFLSSYHQMTSCLIPLPGSAGVSELFFNIIFENYFKSASITTAAQIIWRSATYYLLLVVTGIFSATYSSSPKKEEVAKMSRNTMLTLSYEKLVDRKNGIIIQNGQFFDLTDFDEEIHKRRPKKEKVKKEKPVKIKPKKDEPKPENKEDDEEWEDIVI